MTRNFTITALAAVAIGLFVGLATQAQSGAQSGALVRLQPTSPGVTQVGSAHVSGALIANGSTTEGSAIVGTSTNSAAYAIVGSNSNASGTLRSGGVQASSSAPNGYGIETTGAGTGFGTSLLAKSAGSAPAIISSLRTIGAAQALQIDLASLGSAGVTVEKVDGETTEVGSANGGIYTEGIVYRKYVSGGPRVAAIPLAYGTISSTSIVQSGSGNYGNILASNFFTIIVDDETLSATNATAVITANTTGAPRVATYNFSNGNLQVRIWDMAGNLAPTGFTFVIYSASPASDDGPGGDNLEDRRFGKPVYEYERRKVEP